MFAVPEMENKNDGKCFGAFCGLCGWSKLFCCLLSLESDVTCSVYLRTTLNF